MKPGILQHCFIAFNLPPCAIVHDVAWRRGDQRLEPSVFANNALAQRGGLQDRLTPAEPA